MLHFRALTSNDQEKLWHWLHLALWDPPPAPLRPLEVLATPGVRIYAEEWGRSTDVGLVAMVDGADVGACWVRLLAEGVGLGYVDQSTPQLGIALEVAFQRRGLGRPLMLETLAAARMAGFSRVSLTVHRENRAQYMYEKCGFKKIGLRDTYHLMVANVA